MTDGTTVGWWGPVSGDVATSAKRLFCHGRGGRPCPPDEWARRLRRGTRHSHTGLLTISVGAVELACWDLLGRRHRVPVWRLLTGRPSHEQVLTYATCFGLRLDDLRAARVVEQVRKTWLVQKWRPVRQLTRSGSPARHASAAAGPGGMAFDFGGRWSVADAFALAEALPEPAAFLEEPVTPGEWTSTRLATPPAPLAAGEHCYGIDDAAILSQLPVEIWQPDAVFCGGFVALGHIMSLAAKRGRSVLPHGGGLMPAVHAAVAGRPIDAVELHLVLEPRRQAHLARPLDLDDAGRVLPPEACGWGGDLSPEL